MSKDLYIERLRAVPLFASLSKRDLDLLTRQADHLRFPARYRVVREGTMGQELWLVIDGELAVHRGNRQVATLGPGDFFGELAVIDPSPRDATVIATTPVELLVIGRQRFWSLVQGSPVLMRKLMVELARRLHEADRRDSGIGGDEASLAHVDLRQSVDARRT